MTFRGIISLSLANIWRRKLRTLLTVWGMSVGIGAMVLLISFASGLQKENEKQITSSMSLTRLTVMKEDMGGFGGRDISAAPKGFDEAEIEKLRAIPHVRAVYPTVDVPMVKVELDGQKYDSFLQVTPIEDITDSRRELISHGAWWSANDQRSIVISAMTAEQWKLDPAALAGRSVKLITQVFVGNEMRDGKSYEAIISGVTKKSGNFSMIGDAIAYDLGAVMAKENPSTYPGQVISTGVSSVGLYVDDADNVTAVRQAIEDLGWFSTGLEELLKMINQGFQIMKIVLGIIGGIALFVALIGIANSMLMAILERTREIGVMSALGANRRTISWLFLSEAAWLGFFGALLGVVGAFLLGKAITFGVGVYLSATQSGADELSFIKFSIGLDLFIGTMIGAVLVTLLAGWLPARRAASLDPISALRHD